MKNRIINYYERCGLIKTLIHVLIALKMRVCNMLIAWWKFRGRAPGAQVCTDAYVHGCQYMHIGKGFNAGAHLWIEVLDEFSGQIFSPKLTIGNNVSFSYYGHIGCTHHIDIGNNVLFGSKCYVTDHNHGIYIGNDMSSPNIPPAKRHLTADQSVIIEDNVWVGDNVVILPGVKIGYGSIVGANAVVSNDIPEKSIAVGIPARVIKHWNDETKKWEKVG